MIPTEKCSDLLCCVAFAEVVVSGAVAPRVAALKEAIATRLGAAIYLGTVGAGVAGMIDWAGEEGTKLSVRRNGGDEALRGGLSVSGVEDVLFAGHLCW